MYRLSRHLLGVVTPRFKHPFWEQLSLFGVLLTHFLLSFSRLVKQTFIRSFCFSTFEFVVNDTSARSSYPEARYGDNGTVSAEITPRRKVVQDFRGETHDTSTVAEGSDFGSVPRRTIAKYYREC